MEQSPCNKSGSSIKRKGEKQTMNELQIFNNEEFGQVRTVIIDDVPYLLGKDVAEALGYERPDNAIRNHVDDEDKLMHQISASGQRRNMLVINESGMYALILGSKLPSAKRFKRWVTSEVIPTIRKTGSYNMESETIPKNDNQEMYLEASRILSGCPDNTKPYVINILRHIIPDIDRMHNAEVKTEPEPLNRWRKPYFKQGVGIDIDKMLMTMAKKGINKKELARRAQVNEKTMRYWIDGVHRPVLENRIKVCRALGEDDDFLTPKGARCVKGGY